jgi:hypothetical protein
MAERGKNKEQRIDLGSIVNSAIEEGVGAIIKIHPRFAEQEVLLKNYLDKRKINEYLRDYITHNLSNNNALDEKDLTKKFAGYVVSGEFFDERGQNIILSKGLEEESKKVFRGGIAREILKGEKYLDDNISAFRDLYKLFQTEGNSKRMPKLQEAVATVENMRFADTAINIIYEHGLINKLDYRFLKRAVNERAREEVNYTIKSLKDYAVPQKVAAVVLAGIGLGSLLMNNNITGNVIGAGNPNIFRLLGGILLLVSSILLWFKKK